MAKKLTVEQQVTELVCKALYELETKLVMKFNIESFDEYIDGGKYNKAVDKLVAMYIAAAVANI